jgi:hypothetical protein
VRWVENGYRPLPKDREAGLIVEGLADEGGIGGLLHGVADPHLVRLAPLGSGAGCGEGDRRHPREGGSRGKRP